MKAVQIREPGGPEALELVDVASPTLREGEVLLDVRAAGVNRADLLQRQGHYPPPPGESELPGLEVSGVIAQLPDDLERTHPGHGWAVGDEVCALLVGGGYAEQVAVPVGQLLPAPAGLPLADAAALPETVCTVWSNVFLTARLQPGEVLLAHGGASGIGTTAIQLARAFGARVAVTASTPAKLQACRELGAEILIDYREEDFVERITAETGGRGADVILDLIGAKYLSRNVEALATNGRLVIIGMQGGTRAELDIATLLRKRAAVIATSLRTRPTAEKATIVAAVREHVWPLVEAGTVRPLIHARFPLAEAARAHEALEAGDHIGKIVLEVA